jgi:hypothetical protein
LAKEASIYFFCQEAKSSQAADQNLCQFPSHFASRSSVSQCEVGVVDQILHIIISQTYWGDTENFWNLSFKACKAITNHDIFSFHLACQHPLDPSIIQSHLAIIAKKVPVNSILIPALPQFPLKPVAENLI